MFSFVEESVGLIIELVFEEFVVGGVGVFGLAKGEGAGTVALVEKHSKK